LGFLFYPFRGIVGILSQISKEGRGDSWDLLPISFAWFCEVKARKEGKEGREGKNRKERKEGTEGMEGRETI
jgi:hypothetical protein